MISIFKRIIKNQVIPDLERRYHVKVRIFFDGDFATAVSAVQSPNLIIVDSLKIKDMVHGIKAVCHEYCHLLREVSSDIRVQEIQEFYLKKCREYYDHYQTVEGYLVYRYSLLELDAEAFAQSFGTVCTDHYYELLSKSDLQKAYEENGVRGLVQLIKETYNLV